MFTISPKLVLNRLLYRFAKPGSKADPIYVFHHVPKCGGTSMVKALSTWFHPVFDYRHGWNTTTAKPIPLEHLHSITFCAVTSITIRSFWIRDIQPSSPIQDFGFLRLFEILCIQKFRFISMRKSTIGHQNPCQSSFLNAPIISRKGFQSAPRR